MELNSRELRFCLSIDCAQLKTGKCPAKECQYPDKKVAVEERIARLSEVKYGGNP